MKTPSVKSVVKKRHNKQHDVRAASFKRLAKGFRTDAKQLLKTDDRRGSIYFNIIASRLDAEATLLRSMR